MSLPLVVLMGHATVTEHTIKRMALGFRQGWRGIVGDAILAIELLRETKFVRWTLELFGLGQIVDFIVDHIEKPGWVGIVLQVAANPISQLFIVAIGLALIYWDQKRPRDRKLIKLEPSQIIWIGLIGAIVSVLIMLGGLVLQTQAPPTTPKAVSEQLEKTQRDLKAARAEIVKLQQQKSPAVAPASLGVPTKKIYDAGDMKRRKAELNALRDYLSDDLEPLVNAADKMNNDIFDMLKMSPTAYGERLKASFREQFEKARNDLEPILVKYGHADIRAMMGAPPSMELPITRYISLLAILGDVPLSDADLRRKVMDQSAREDFTQGVSAMRAWIQQARYNIDQKSAEYETAEVRE